MGFIYYAQVVNADGLNEEMKELYRERVLANRKTSAELSTASLELPSWYSWWLKVKGRTLEDAARLLIRYSNTTDYGQSGEVETAIRKYLGLPIET